MQPNLETAALENAAEPTPVLEVIENLATEELFKAAWDCCCQPRWVFGHGSNTGGWSRFWRMDLEQTEAFREIWKLAKPRCEQLAGGPLEVIRVYANGHTYGLGGEAHRDDGRDGTFTLLYYPNPEWRDGWDGETVYYDDAGEVALAVRVRPNRAVFFDSRILHVGRPPSRQCTALRVTVAYKLQLAGLDGAAETEPALAPAVETPAAPEPGGTEIAIRETRREGMARVFTIRIPAERLESAINARLVEIGSNVRLPGFRPGNVPIEVLQQRYGAKTRHEMLAYLTGRALDLRLPRVFVPGKLEIKSGVTDGPGEIDCIATYMPDLPPLDPAAIEIERLTVEEAALEAAGIDRAVAEARLREHADSQVLDALDRQYPFPVVPPMVGAELQNILRAAGEDAIPAAGEEREAALAQFQGVAERRLRLGYIVAEMARRFELRAPSGPEVERLVVDRIAGLARVRERAATAEELRELTAE